MADARQYHTQQVHYLRKTINFNDTGVSSGVLVGGLPAGAQIVDAIVNIRTAFNAAGSNSIAVGTNSTNFDNIVASADVSASAAAAYRATVSSSLDYISSASDVFVRYTQGGTAATTGVATVVIGYVPDNDR